MRKTLVLLACLALLGCRGATKSAPDAQTCQANHDCPGNYCDPDTHECR